MGNVCRWAPLSLCTHFTVGSMHNTILFQWGCFLLVQLVCYKALDQLLVLLLEVPFQKQQLWKIKVTYILHCTIIKYSYNSTV